MSNKEEKAADYFTNRNNYMRIAAYKESYQKYNNGIQKEKYMILDFSYLQNYHYSQLICSFV